jgi:hypothetical protein
VLRRKQVDRAGACMEVQREHLFGASHEAVDLTLGEESRCVPGRVGSLLVVPAWALPVPVSGMLLQACIRPLIARFSPASAGLGSASITTDDAQTFRGVRVALDTGDNQLV